MASLTINKSKIYPDINDILKNPADKYVAQFIIEAKLHTADKDLTSCDGIILNSIYIIRDYVNNMSDYIEVQLSLHLGTYLYDVYKYVDNLEVTIIKYRQLYQGKKPVITKDRYKAVYLLDKNAAIPTTVNQAKDDLNQGLPITLTLQLLDRSAETIRVKTTQGNFDKATNPKNKNMSPKAFLNSIISEECNKILIENKPSIDCISIENPDNADELKAITIPSNTRIVELPEYIQTKNIGMYNAGIGNYIQSFGVDPFTYKKTFFVYSLYNGDKFKKADYKIIFYNPTTSSCSIGDRTYTYKDKVLKILPHTISKIYDNTVLPNGSGFRIGNANSYMCKPVEMTESGPVFNRNRVNTEVIYKDRKDNLNFAPNRGVSNNQFAIASGITADAGGYINIDVSNIDHDFIYPGPCKIVYEDTNNKVNEVFGVIHKAVITYNQASMSLMANYNNRFVSLSSHITLQVFIARS